MSTFWDFALRAGRVARRLAEETVRDIRSGDLAKPLHQARCLAAYGRGCAPYALYLEVSRACNLRCPACPTQPWRVRDDRPALMSWETYRRVVEDVRGSVHYLHLYSTGEPLLNPRLPDFIRHAGRLRMHTTVSSNFLELDERSADELTAAGLDRIMVSLDGASAATYERFKRRGDFDLLTRNVALLAEVKRKWKSAKPLLDMQLIIDRANRGETAAFLRLAARLGADCVSFKTLGVPRALLPEREARRLMDFLPTQERLSRYRGGRVIPGSKCVGMRMGCVASNGRLAACIFDVELRLSPGHALETPFPELWRSVAYRDLRRKMAARSLPPCASCQDSAVNFLCQTPARRAPCELTAPRPSAAG